jgi:small-conductance mechanosensitive channel
MFEELFVHSLVLFGIVFGTALVLGLGVRLFLFRILGRYAERTETKIDDIVLKAARGPSYIWCVLLSLVVAINFLKVELRQYNVLFKLVLVVLIISITTALIRLSRGIIRHYTEEVEERLPITSLGQNIASAFIISLSALIILSVVGISITPILTALGVGGLAVALGLQDTLANIFAGIHIILSKTLRAGDYIRLQSGEEGYVQDITWRQTKVLTLANNIVLVPNAKLSQTIVTNFHQPDPALSVPVQVSVGYETAPDRVEGILVEEYKLAAPELPGLIPGKEPTVRFAPGFGDSALQFTLWCPVKEFSEQFAVQHHLRKRLYDRFRKEGIRIPYPQRDVHITPPPAV